MTYKETDIQINDSTNREVQICRTDIKMCIWDWNNKDGGWKTRCNNEFYLPNSPMLCGMKYCPFCGLPLVEGHKP